MSTNRNLVSFIYMKRIFDSTFADLHNHDTPLWNKQTPLWFLRKFIWNKAELIATCKLCYRIKILVIYSIFFYRMRKEPCVENLEKFFFITRNISGLLLLSGYHVDTLNRRQGHQGRSQVQGRLANSLIWDVILFFTISLLTLDFQQSHSHSHFLLLYHTNFGIMDFPSRQRNINVGKTLD